METKPKHTPTPWEFVAEEIWSGCHLIAQMKRTAFADPTKVKANAAFIVRAVNSHEALLHEAKNYRESMAMEGENTKVSYLNKLIAQAEGK